VSEKELERRLLSSSVPYTKEEAFSREGFSPSFFPDTTEKAFSSFFPDTLELERRLYRSKTLKLKAAYTRRLRPHTLGVQGRTHQALKAACTSCLRPHTLVA
jgi:hypothetical protein